MLSSEEIHVDSIVTSFKGRNGSGSITGIGAEVKAGDAVVGVALLPGQNNNGGSAKWSFETEISVNGAIKQNDGSDLSALTFVAVIIPRVQTH